MQFLYLYTGFFILQKLFSPFSSSGRKQATYNDDDNLILFVGFNWCDCSR